MPSCEKKTTNSKKKLLLLFLLRFVCACFTYVSIIMPFHCQWAHVLLYVYVCTTLFGLTHYLFTFTDCLMTIKLATDLHTPIQLTYTYICFLFIYLFHSLSITFAICFCFFNKDRCEHSEKKNKFRCYVDFLQKF